MPLGVQLDYPWTIQQIPIGEQVDHLAYSSSSGMYVIGTSHRTEFKLPEDDELHPEWRNESMSHLLTSVQYAHNITVTSFFPEVQRSSLKVVNPKTWTVIDRYEAIAKSPIRVTITNIAFFSTWKLSIEPRRACDGGKKHES